MLIFKNKFIYMNIYGHIIHICSFIMHPNITFLFQRNTRRWRRKRFSILIWQGFWRNKLVYTLSTKAELV